MVWGILEISDKRISAEGKLLGGFPTMSIHCNCRSHQDDNACIIIHFHLQSRSLLPSLKDSSIINLHKTKMQTLLVNQILEPVFFFDSSIHLLSNWLCSPNPADVPIKIDSLAII